jgi:hypothetical protein
MRTRPSGRVAVIFVQLREVGRANAGVPLRTRQVPLDGTAAARVVGRAQRRALTVAGLRSVVVLIRECIRIDHRLLDAHAVVANLRGHLVRIDAAGTQHRKEIGLFRTEMAAHEWNQ